MAQPIPFYNIRNEYMDNTVLIEFPMDPQDPMFYALELARSLQECLYGIHSYVQQLGSRTKLQSSATVRLLDDNSSPLTVVYDIHGYYIQHKSSRRESFLRRFKRRSSFDSDSSGNEEPPKTYFRNLFVRLRRRRSSASSNSTSFEDPNAPKDKGVTNIRFSNLEYLLCIVSPIFNQKYQRRVGISSMSTLD